MLSCSNCMEKGLEENVIFCPNCGSDIVTDSKIKKYTTRKNNIVIQAKSNPDISLHLSSESIADYQNLTHEVQDLIDTPHKLTLATNQLQFMESKLKEDEDLLENLQKELKKNEKLTKKYENISISFIIATVEGNKNQKIKKEEKEHSTLLFKIETLEKEIADQKDEIKTAIERKANLNRLNQHFQDDQKALETLIIQVTSGKSDSTIEKLESDLNKILLNKKSLDEQLHKSLVILNYLKSVIPDLNDVYVQLKLYCEYARGGGGGFYLNNTVFFNMRLNFVKAKTSLARAGRNINLAGNVDQQISQVNSIVKDINEIWNTVINYSSNLGICGSKETIPKTMQGITNNCNTISSNINSIKSDILSLTDKISKVQDSILAERTKMIQEGISLQNNS